MRTCPLLLLMLAAPAAASPQPFPVSGGQSASASGLYFKPGKGLVAESADGNFQVATGLRIQLRYSYRDAEEATHELQVRRLRLNLGGFAFGRHNTFKIQYAMSPDDLDEGSEGVRHVPMLDAYVRFTHVRDLNLQVGQFKVHFSRQRIASSGKLTLVDRPIADDEFTLDRDMGAVLLSDDFLGADLLSYVVGVFTGQGKSGYLAAPAAPLAMIRLSLRPFGKFDEYTGPDLERLQSPKLAIGGAFAHHADARGIRGNRGFDATAEARNFNHATADLTFKWSGWAILGGFYWRESADAADGSNASGTGLFAETSLVFPRHPLDLGVRYSQVRGADDASVVVDRDELGVGMNYYLADHYLKATADYIHLWGDAGFGEGEELIRLQLQLQL